MQAMPQGEDRRATEEEMSKRRFKRFGPFSYFRVNKGVRNFISAWPTGHDNDSFGWEWGEDGFEDLPVHIVRLGGFTVFGYEKFSSGGFLLTILGFWWLA